MTTGVGLRPRERPTATSRRYPARTASPSAVARSARLSKCSASAPVFGPVAEPMPHALSHTVRVSAIAGRPNGVIGPNLVYDNNARGVTRRQTPPQGRAEPQTELPEEQLPIALLATDVVVRDR